VKRHVLVFIHGVSLHGPELKRPLREGRDTDHPGIDPGFAHTSQYDAFQQGVSGLLSGSVRTAWDEAAVCRVEWGDHTDSDAHSFGAVHRLSSAQQQLASRVAEVMGRVRFALIPRGVRRLSLVGLSDAFYCISADGSKNVRRLVEWQLMESLEGLLDEGITDLDLTVVGHSAGTIIALDWIQYLFGDPSPIRDDFARLEDAETALETHRAELTEDRSAEGLPFGFRKVDAVALHTTGLLRRFTRLVVDGRVRLRLLVTMGSPICMLAFRSDLAIRDLAYGERIPLSRLGLNSESTGDAVQWLNLWNKNDPVSFPVEPMVDSTHSVEDRHVRPSWDVRKSHTGYWSSRAVHRVVADIWARAL